MGLNQKENKWREIVNLTKEEAKKCRFVCIEPSLRLFACKTHNLRHGLRLHPPHKFEVKNGIVYVRVDNKLKVWYSKLYAKKKDNRGGGS